MYYSNIQNKELAYFHNRPVHNFTVKLSQMLESDLFQVEEIITDKIYKIYPLFYTNSITSSNSNDRILDNKVIICQKTDEETYLTFKSNDGEVVDFSDYGTYYNIGDSLTMAQFNAYISLLRQNVKHNEEISIKDTVNGAYGTYLFDIEDTTLIDSGMIVSDETIQAEPKIKLSDWSFTASKYLLKLQILHYTGANILDDNTTDFKVVDTLEIELQRGKWVNIPVESIEKDYIISLNAEIIIDHSTPIIQDYPTLIDLTADKTIIQTDEVLDLTATVTDDVKSLTGIPVYFYEAYEPTLLKLTGDKSIMQSGDVLDLKATLKDEDGSLIEGETVYFYQAEDIDYYAYYETIDEGDNIEELALPSKFKIEFDLEVTGTSSTSNAFIRFNNSRGTYCGKGSSSSNNITFGSNVLEQITDKTTYTIEYDGTDVVFSSPNNSITVNNVTLTSLYSLSRNGATVIDNIRITDLSEE